MVLEIAGIALGLREGVIALIVMVAIYMAVVIVRLRRPSPVKKTVPAPVVVKTPPLPESAPEPDPEPEPPSAWERAAAVAVAPDEERLYRSLENEVFQLRDEVDAVRGELAALRSDMLHELAQMRASQTVSPIYGDAMQMAAAGYDPSMIAERCGIARAEAELVVALAKSTNS
ncbi:MAG: hypothetical protein RLZZ298_1987 [Pseudomonadota bacterium]